MRFRRVGRRLVHPLTLVCAAALVVAILVWFAGPLLAFGDRRPLAGTSMRLALLLATAFVWGVVAVWLASRPAAADRRLVEGLRRQAEEAQAASRQASGEAEARIGDIRRTLADALSRLARGRRSWRRPRPAYRLPWYLVIGPAGAGKTAMILDGGLDLPLGVPRGVAAGEASGDCEVLVTDRAVFALASGRLSQDAAGRPIDRAVWLGLLEALRRQRGRQPVCGVVLAVDIPATLALDEEARRALAKDLRRRLDEIAEAFRARPPVYVVFTKLDELLGFNAFFETLDRREREQHLGFALLRAEGDGEPVFEDRIRLELAALARGLGRRELDRMEDEADVRQRALVHEFPLQFAALAEGLAPFLGILAFPHQFDAPPFLRGVFFASARQEPRAVDLVGRPAGAAFGQPNALARPADTDAAHSRPFFLASVFRNLVLPEAALGGRSRHARRMFIARRVAAAGALTLLLLALGAHRVDGYRAAGTYAAATHAEARSVRQSLADTRFGDRLPPFREILPVLDRMRDLARGPADGSARGVEGVATLEGEARDAYAAGLDRLFVPYLFEGLTASLSDGETPPADLFGQLKLYLALGGARPLGTIDLAASATLLDRAWLGAFEPDERVSFAGHLLALGEFGASPREPVVTVVEEARERIADYTLGRLALDLVRARPEIVALPAFRPADHASGRVVARTGGESLFAGPPGLFTRAPFRDVTLPALGAAARGIGEDAWVLGAGSTGEIDVRTVSAGALALFSAEYARSYDTLLSELGVVPMPTPADGARVLRAALTAPSPVSDLLAAIAAETDLSPSPSPADDAAAAVAALPGAGALLQAVRADPEAGQAVTEAFAPLRAAVAAAGDGPSQVGAALLAFDPVYRQLNHVAAGGNILELGTEPQSAMADVAAAIEALPAAAQPLFRRMAEAASALLNGTAADRLRAAWTSTVLPACLAATRDRFPFDPGSASDTPFDDMTAVFAPKGQIAAFRETYLAPAIDTTARPWRWRPGRREALGLPEGTLRAFEHADAITRAFFPDGDAIGTGFSLEITELDPRAQAVRFDVGGATLRYANGPATALAARWPPTTPNAPAVLSVTPEIDGARNMIVGEGSWALFRLMNQAASRRLVDGNSFAARFTLAGRRVDARITPASSQNPFELMLLESFRCPEL